MWRVLEGDVPLLTLGNHRDATPKEEESTPLADYFKEPFFLPYCMFIFHISKQSRAILTTYTQRWDGRQWFLTFPGASSPPLPLPPVDGLPGHGVAHVGGAGEDGRAEGDAVDAAVAAAAAGAAARHGDQVEPPVVVVVVAVAVTDESVPISWAGLIVAVLVMDGWVEGCELVTCRQCDQKVLGQSRN